MLSAVLFGVFGRNRRMSTGLDHLDEIGNSLLPVLESSQRVIQKFHLFIFKSGHLTRGERSRPSWPTSINGIDVKIFKWSLGSLAEWPIYVWPEVQFSVRLSEPRFSVCCSSEYEP